MSGFFMTLMIVAMIATAGALGIGLVGMIKGGEFNDKYGNKLMRLRVILQGAALACLALAIVSSRA
jgi:hypothetical protein